MMSPFVTMLDTWLKFHPISVHETMMNVYDLASWWLTIIPKYIEIY